MDVTSSPARLHLTSPDPSPEASTTPDASSFSALRSEVLEQVMRLTGDDLLPLLFLDAAVGSAQAATALGRLLHAHPVRLVDRCPLVALTTGRDIDPHWRQWCPTRPQSLWEALEDYRLLYGPVPDAADALAELEQLRSTAVAA